MKLNPKTEAVLITIGTLCLIALFVTLVMFSPEFLYIIILSGVAIAAVRAIYDMALDHIERRNKIKKLKEDIDADKMEKNNVRI